MTLHDWLAYASARLERADVDTPRLDAELLAAHYLGETRSWLHAHLDDAIDDDLIDPLLERRANREPLAYILGYREFYSRPFRVDPRVLVPRPETELIVERALLMDSASSRGFTVLDVGTGSGCLAVTMASERPNWQVTAVDVSPDALVVASENAMAHNVDIEFVESDLTSALTERQFDLVVSNPPYVGYDDFLPPEVREFEPSVALYAEGNGTAIYRRLAAECAPNVKGALILEIGDGMVDIVEAIFSEFGWTLSDTLTDLSGKPRCLTFLPPL